MKRIFPNVLLITALLLLNFQQLWSQRILYVDQFYHILGDEDKEESLLNFTRDNGFDKIILYDLHKINKDYPLSDFSRNGILAQFISKAKLKYGIKEVSGSGENGEFFINAIDAYNRSRKNESEKFDAYNLEYEYWKPEESADGGYYCESYLEKFGRKCNRQESFRFYIESLATMKALAKKNRHKVKIEAYVGRFTKGEIEQISKYVDRLLVHVYVNHPKKGFFYANKRLQYLSELDKKPKVSIIYSSEILFMGGWFKYNSLTKAEKIFVKTMEGENNSLAKQINFTNFTYYNYNYLSKSINYYANASHVYNTEDIPSNVSTDLK